ncbi:hypothetical protein EJ04DRAFT_527634 [Polyplosphaeria fusca]|uniref:Uncharacterized protein n=1 Tax=Polyplosphaeria fusca TaxID=682080 RepID=A0A9P4QRR7_9PLEO|nr:hypothetical protein EJ04DRAFT_527634 [Polyplosphaeria fusca]
MAIYPDEEMAKIWQFCEDWEVDEEDVHVAMFMQASVLEQPTIDQQPPAIVSTGNTTSYQCSCLWSRKFVVPEMRMNVLKHLVKSPIPLTADNTWQMMRECIWAKWKTCRCLTDSMVVIFWKINDIKLQPSLYRPTESSKWTVVLPLPPRHARAWLSKVDFHPAYSTLNPPKIWNPAINKNEAIGGRRFYTKPVVWASESDIIIDIDQISNDTWQKLRDVCSTGQLFFLHLVNVCVYFDVVVSKMQSFYKWFIWINTGGGSGVKINTDIEGWEHTMEKALEQREMAQMLDAARDHEVCVASPVAFDHIGFSPSLLLI